MKKITILYAALIFFGLALLVGRFLVSEEAVGPVEEIKSFEECVVAGFSVMESYPRQCRTDAGELFVEDVGDELEKSELVRVSTPRPNDFITSPLFISGEARGYWFFEADFPVKLFDEQGNLLAEWYATAKDDWMTEEFVPFTSELKFESPPAGTRGDLILEKDNPKGLPEYDDSFRIPVKFSGNGDSNDVIGEPNGVSDGDVLENCVPAGCSAQVCAPASLAPEIITDCAWREEYDCLALTVCERQPDGECGWTPNEEFDACMAELSS